MPTYDYECGACQHAWEEFQSMGSKPLRKCPACGRLKAKRVIGPGAGFIFKGSGFYLTDYRSESYQSGAEADRKSREATPASADAGSKASEAGGKPAETSASGSASASAAPAPGGKAAKSSGGGAGKGSKPKK